MAIKQELRIINKDIKALIKKIEKILEDVVKIDEAKVAKKAKPKPVKAKTRKSVAPRKLTVKKKTAKPTATGEVLRIIRRSKNGVDAATLMKKTGFNQKKISNIIHRCYKQGKIKRVGKGLYRGA